jgi:acyl-coenzyme A thioesterase PaaI-like protein
VPAEPDFQDRLFADSTCFGCGPANPHGFRLRSRWIADRTAVVATWTPEPYHGAGFPGALHGGVAASLIDCHSAWTAIAFAYRAAGRDVGEGEAILYVTAELGVRYLRPTPIGGPLHLRAWAEGEIGRRVRVRCELGDGETVTATGDSVFARVRVP